MESDLGWFDVALHDNLGRARPLPAAAGEGTVVDLRRADLRAERAAARTQITQIARIASHIGRAETVFPGSAPPRCRDG